MDGGEVVIVIYTQDATYIRDDADVPRASLFRSMERSSVKRFM